MPHTRCHPTLAFSNSAIAPSTFRAVDRLGHVVIDRDALAPLSYRVRRRVMRRERSQTDAAGGSG
jgi:hypothetical protein